MIAPADSATPVEDLLARARAYVTYSHAKNTLQAYAADWKHFSVWCDGHKRRRLARLTRNDSLQGVSSSRRSADVS